MNILFPIAGSGLRFKNQGIPVPKPLVEVSGKSLLEYSISTLKIPGHYIYVTVKYDNEWFNKQIEETIKRLQPDASILYVDKITRGAAETCLYAEDLIDNNESLVVTNCDQYFNWNPQKLADVIEKYDPDGCVSLYDHDDVQEGQPSRYAFVKLDEQGYAICFAEKFAISKNSMNGIHYWKHGKDFVSSIKRMINDKITVNGEFYISPSYNYLIEDGKKIVTFKMDKEEYRSLGSPEEIYTNLMHIK